MVIEIDNILLFEARDSDFEFFYDLKSEENNVYWSGYVEQPNYDNLKNWFNKILTNKEKDILIIKYKNIDIGYISYKIYNDILCDDFSIAISEKYSGNGIGTKAMKLFFNHIKDNFVSCEKIYSYIREDNIASQHIHKNNGYILTTEYEKKYFGIDNEEYKMQRWIKNMV